MSLLLAQQKVILRDIIMKNIPNEMLAISPKGTVPVLILTNSLVIDESLDIMLWALKQNDPHDLLLRKQADALPEMLRLIKHNDEEFVAVLEKYKTVSRYHDIAEEYYRQQCEAFVLLLEQRLTEHDYFMGSNPGLVDYALLPFIRQFSRVDRKWFLQSPYTKIQHWLRMHYQNPLYSKAMKKHPQWTDTREDIMLGD